MLSVKGEEDEKPVERLCDGELTPRGGFVLALPLLSHAGALLKSQLAEQKKKEEEEKRQGQIEKQGKTPNLQSKARAPNQAHGHTHRRPKRTEKETKKEHSSWGTIVKRKAR